MPDQRLLARARAAFVDRATINWNGLRVRASSASAARIIEGLRLLDALRASHRRPEVTPPRAVRVAIWSVLLVATAQIVCALLVICVARLAGDPWPDRPAQLALFVAFGVAAAILFVRSRDARSMPLVAWLATFGSVYGGSAMHGLALSWYSPVDGFFRGACVEAFAPACLWQFAVVFPRVGLFTRFDTLASGVARGCWLLGAALLLVNLVVAHDLGVGTPISQLARGHPSNIYWCVVLLAVLPAVAVIFARSRRAPVVERQKVRRFALALTAGTAPVLLLAAVLSVSPAAVHWLATNTNARFWIDCVVIGGLAAMPLLVTAAILVDRPLTLDAAFNPASLHSIANGVLTFLPLIPFWASVTLLYEQRHDSLATIVSGSDNIAIVVYATVGVVLVALRRPLLASLNRVVSRRDTDQRTQLTRALERVRLARGPRETAAILARELRHGIGTRSAVVLVASRGHRFIDAARVVPELPHDSSLCAVLRETQGPLDVSVDSELYALLPTRESAWVRDAGASLLVPLKQRDEHLAAIAVLGIKRGNAPFDRDDEWFMTALTTAVAATWADDPDDDAQLSRRSPRDADAAFECRHCGRVADRADLPCGCTVPPRLAAVPARLAGKFDVRRRLGAGGMGVVYLARDLVLQRDVALKTLPRLSPGSVARLHAEARAMARFSHDGLAAIYGTETWRRIPILVVEYLTGGTLAARLRAGPLGTAEAVALGLHLARALDAMHGHGVLHGDLKPTNIGFTAAGVPKLLDFGLAVLTESTTELAPRQDRHGGTRGYLPPEAAHHSPPGAAFDLWALALVLLETVSGTTQPHAGHADAIARVPDPIFRSLLTDALQRDPKRRPNTAADFVRALELVRTSCRVS